MSREAHKVIFKIYEIMILGFGGEGLPLDYIDGMMLYFSFQSKSQKEFLKGFFSYYHFAERNTNREAKQHPSN